MMIRVNGAIRDEICVGMRKPIAGILTRYINKKQMLCECLQYVGGETGKRSGGVKK